MIEDEAARLLDLLQAHGQQFLNSFDLSQPPRKRQRIEESPEELESEDFEEWRGFSNAAVESYASEEDNDDDTPYEYDDGFTASSSAKMPDVVVFSDSRPKPSEQFSKAQKKAFMSSKVAKVTSTTEADGVPHQDEDDIQNDNEDISNAQNDALLHRLVHTKLLSGSLNPELNLTHAQREKALSGRVLELAGKTKLGKGEVAIRAAERNKASKRVREGLSRKKNEREKQELEEAKNLGNYHPTLKKLFDASSSGSSDRQRRVRGIGMGVGKFSGGTLKLSREEINSVTGRGVHGTARRGHKTSRGRR
ncbi:hypothetical protein DEU56DRAFT_786186 [Suillus clintonianus]|uniref:uncharacterized protein n=1 Tax=Suillus clintonianus TaxID=1904413 RepID=UPI001B886035|nr:uncharacterized protein DEU56DRAFT_786186 [Suillus clintonianus]KAG2146743.1 hypothetical protein DEU56DRAFT_786186 [Suillus clintonianus]